MKILLGLVFVCVSGGVLEVRNVMGMDQFQKGGQAINASIISVIGYGGLFDY